MTGRISTNVQNLDIAPTIVDSWALRFRTGCTGNRCWGNRLTRRDRYSAPVFAATPCDGSYPRTGPSKWTRPSAGPPLYLNGSVGMIVGQRVYSLDLIHPTLIVHDLADHTAPLSEAELPSTDAATETLVDHLRDVVGM